MSTLNSVNFGYSTKKSIRVSTEVKIETFGLQIWSIMQIDWNRSKTQAPTFSLSSGGLSSQNWLD